MHLIVNVADDAHAAAPDARHPPWHAPQWAALLREIEPSWRLEGSRDTLSTPAEQARATLVMGRPTASDEDGLWPWAAWSLGRTGAWARLSPCHGQVGSDRIVGIPPWSLDLDAQESRALFDAVQPLFASEGVGLEWAGPLAWHAEHESLRGLPCASLDRMAGDALQRWQSRTPLRQARLIRRLQNEAQMVLHAHPVNASRLQRGQWPVNSLWLSDAGAADQVQGAPELERVQALIHRIHTTEAAGALEAAQAWLKAWADGPTSPTHPTLVLCGRAHAQAFIPHGAGKDGGPGTAASAPHRAPWWSRLLRPLRTTVRPPRTMADWIAGLDEHTPTP